MVFQYIEHQETHLAMHRRMIRYKHRISAEKSRLNIKPGILIKRQQELYGC